MHNLTIGTMAVLARQRLFSTQLKRHFSAVAGALVESFEAVVWVVDFVGRPELPLLVFRKGVLLVL